MRSSEHQVRLGQAGQASAWQLRLPSELAVLALGIVGGLCGQEPLPLEPWRDEAHGGANVLYLQLRACGYDVTYPAVLAQLARRGGKATLAVLRDAATELGADVGVGFGAAEALAAEAWPVVVHLDPPTGGEELGGGYGLVVGVKERVVTIYDGATALRQDLGIEALKRLWSGHVLTMRPSGVTWAGRWLRPACLASGLIACLLLCRGLLRRSAAPAVVSR